MDARTFGALEFDRVLDALSSFALSSEAQARCRAIGPLMEPSLLEAERGLLEEGLGWSREIMAGLTSFPDMQGVLTSLEREEVLDEDGLWGIGYLLAQADKARQALKAIDAAKAPRLAELASLAAWPEKTGQGVKRCLDENGEIKDESLPELASVRRELRSIQQQCTRKMNEFLRKEGIGEYLQDEYLTVSADRYVVALKSNFKGRVEGIIHDYSQSGETCYFEPLLLVELNNRLQELRQKEREARRKVLIYLSGLAVQELESLRSLFEWMVRLDILRAKIVFALEFGARPVQSEPGAPFRLKQVRNPLLLLEHEAVTPVDIELQAGQSGLIISGGNSGGKTVALKTLGLAAVMTLCALPLPAEEGSSLPWWSDVFVCMGDEQNLQEHLSTFTAQIDHLKQAWPSLDEESLVLLDEFGAGTDPSQGAALAQAVIDGLLDKRVWFAAATHFPALKAYALATTGVRAASVLFDSQSKKPLYTLAYDQVGASQALDVARDRGFPPDILRRAEEYLLLDGQDSSQLLSRLNDLAVTREHEIEELRHKQDRLEREKAEQRRKRHEEMDRLASEIRRVSQRVLEEWKQGKISRKKALRELGQQKQRLSGQEEHAQEGSAGKDIWDTLQPGQSVRYPKWNKNGVILDKDDKGRKLKVDLGGVTVWLSVEEVTLPQRTANRSEEQAVRVDSGSTGSYMLDLRGQRADEAEAALSRSLDRAILQGRSELEVIHGRGTGALRSAVHQILQSFSGVASFELAPEDRGGDGVTLVHLKE
jgi:DNA mismatch repair protein MutS2